LDYRNFIEMNKKTLENTKTDQNEFIYEAFIS
jgi:hypothetical protein